MAPAEENDRDDDAKGISTIKLAEQTSFISALTYK